ncbi:hypothetical protein FJNA_22550 [Thermus sp. FJN-A]
MRRWAALLLLLAVAQAQSFFSLSAVDKSVFGFGQALPAGVWWRVGVDHNLEASAHLYLRREGLTNPLFPLLGFTGLGFPGAYYLGLGVEGDASGVHLSGLLGLEAFLGEGFAVFLEGMAPVSRFSGPHFGVGLRYYPSGREAFTPVFDPERRFRLYVPGPVLTTAALAYEGEGYALWLGGWPFWPSRAPWPALGGQAYLGDAFLGFGVSYTPWGWDLSPYVGYRFPLGEGVEAHLRLQPVFWLLREGGLGGLMGFVYSLLGFSLVFPL